MLQLREERARYVAADPQVRTCSRCGEAKRIDEFPIKNKATGLRRVWCRDCCRAYGREHYQKNKPVYLAKAARRRGPDRQRIRDLIRQYLLAHPCVDCGETNILLLDFDHRDRSEKRDMISRIALGGSWPRVLREIEKCDVRCANCHRLRTAGQLRWRKDPARGALPAPLIALLGPTLTRPSITGAAVTEQLSIWSLGTLKRCPRCGKDKPIHEFSFTDRKTRERNAYRRSCQAAYRRDHYRRQRDAYIKRARAQVQRKREEQVRLLHEYLRSHRCVDCGEADIRVLEFDHVDGEKDMDVGAMLGRRSWTKILAEIAKCDVRCANCHRQRTAREAGWRARISEARGKYRGSLQFTRFAGVA